MPITQKEKDFIILLGKRIVELRGSKNMKQKELADLLDIEDSSLRRIESGRTNPTIKTLLRISKGLGVELLELLDVYTSKEKEKNIDQ